MKKLTFILPVLFVGLFVRGSQSIAGGIPNPNGVLFGTYCSTETPETIIDDGSTTTNSINIGSGPTITDINVRLYITHTFDDDLDVFLDSPNSTNVELFTDVGGGNDNFGTTCGDQISTFPDFVLADGAPPIPAAPGVAGTFSPEGSLSDYFLESSIGTWTLNLTDDVSGIDEGTLQCWCLDIYSTGEGCSPGFWGHRALKDNSDEFAGCPSIDPDIEMEDLFDACDLDSCLPNNIEFAEADEILNPKNRTNSKFCDGKAGAAAQLLRQATAALLNVCSLDVDYPLSADEIESRVCSLLTNIDGGGGTPKEDITAFSEELTANNSQECTVDVNDPTPEFACDNPAEVTTENCGLTLWVTNPCGTGECPLQPDAGACFPTPGGLSSGCFDGTASCTGLTACPNGQVDCASDEICLDTCCQFSNGGFDVCYPLAAACPAQPAMMSAPSILDLYINDNGPSTGGSGLSFN